MCNQVIIDKMGLSAFMYLCTFYAHTHKDTHTHTHTHTYTHTHTHIHTSFAATAKVLKLGKVRVGWVYASAREKKLVIRCFKCLEFGHVAAECSKNILEKLCYKCGELGHLAAGCGKPYKFLACEATGKSHGHRTGDVTCASLQIARVKLDNRQNGNG